MLDKKIKSVNFSHIPGLILKKSLRMCGNVYQFPHTNNGNPKRQKEETFLILCHHKASKEDTHSQTGNPCSCIIVL